MAANALNEEEDKVCVACERTVREPFISCAECHFVQLCVQCFAKGEENGTHDNSHRYEVVKNNFFILESQWTAKEEILLLDAIHDCGLGNWEDVSNRMKTKSKTECESHYFEFYIDNASSPLLFNPEQNSVNSICPAPIAHKVCDDPPRPALDSQLYFEMAGYMAGRGDFNMEFDNNAEQEICHLEFGEDDDPLDIDLKLSLLCIYNNRLRARLRRKKILSKYGLINIRKAALSMRRYSAMLGSYVTDGLMPFMQLLEPISFDLFAESLHYEADLKERIKLLQEFREMGLTRFFSTRIYARLKHRRNEKKMKQKQLDTFLDQIQAVTCQQWLHRIALTENKTDGLTPSRMSNQRKSAPPLNIVGLPGYEKLSPSEREICSEVRFVPEAYLEYKTILIGEYQKNGYLRLSQARPLIKIDVNKTRKLFDFLLKEGLISTEKPHKSEVT